jgi:transposase InsO family protein
MGRQAEAEYLARMRVRYVLADRRAKGVLLDEICAVTGWHRKAVIRRLRGGERRTPAARAGQRRDRGHTRVLVTAALRQVWEAADRPCGKRLAPFLGELVASLERHGELALDEATRTRLASLSAATVDRWLKPTRTSLPRRPRSGTAALGGLATEVAVRTFAEWADAVPGEVQGDLVVHCGVTTAGFYLTSLVLVDVATGWLEVEPVWGLSQERVGGALDAARRRLPLALLAFHTDNGGEFLNARVQPYCRRRGIRTTRGRPYKKNDQAWVEQRNWTAVRRFVGYGRFSSKAAFAQLARVYAPLRLYFNFFQPIRKVVAKERVGARVRKRFDRAQTPYQRLLASGVLTPDQQAVLSATYHSLNPVALLAQIHAALNTLRPLAEPDRGWTPALADRIPGLPPSGVAG